MADEPKTATALAALKHPTQKPDLWQPQVSLAILPSATTKESMMCVYVGV